MVQRKVPNKLGIQADHVKSEKRLGNLKPSSSQHQDGKNRGADLKKKMKKSKSIKRSDFESLRSPSLRREVPQPGKPPPPDVPKTAATPQKQSPTKASDGSPNYMKSTSSFDARKERPQVSSRNSQTGTYSKSPSTKTSNNSKLSSASGHKMGRTLTRTSSLKLVRTLTKSPSFKPVRATVKKCSQVALCENLNVHRATCSSTLKDSKFPTYLTLSPGGTESSGASAMKVCSYTYCSLNGHHHTPLPPLKCFLSARRRMLKTQKSMKLGCLSPRRAKPSGDGMQELDIGQVNVDVKPAIPELDLNSSAIPPLIQEEYTDFFIEIYMKNGEDTAETTGGSKHNGDDQDTTDFALNDFMPSVGGSDETAAEHDDGQVAESLSDELSHSEIDFENHLNQHGDIISTEMDFAEIFPEDDQNVEAAEVYPPTSAEEETTLECTSNQSNLEAETRASIEHDEPDSEASDMDWEEGPYYAPYLDHGVENPAQFNNESDLERGYSLEIDNPNFRDEPISKSDDIVSSSVDEIPADEVRQEFFGEESMSFEACFGDSDSESDGSYQNLESDECIPVFDNQSHDQLSPTYNEFEELTNTKERNRIPKSDDLVGTAITSAPIEEPTEEPRAAREEKNGVSEADHEIPRMDLQLGDDKTDCTSDIEDEALTDHQENESLQADDARALLGNQQPTPHDFSEQDQDVTYKDYTASHNIIEVYQSDAAIEEGRFIEEVFDGSFLPKTEDSEMDQNFLEQELSTADAGDGMEEKEQVHAAKSLAGVAPDLLQGFSEADQDMTQEDNDESKLDAIAKDAKSNPASADEGLPTETQYYSSDKQSQSNNIVESQNNSEEDRDTAEKFKSLSSLDSQDHTHSGLHKFRLASNQDADEMKLEERTESDAEETCPTAKKTAGTVTKNVLFHSGSHFNQELPKTSRNPRGTIRRKRPNEDWEKPRKFNPREPNFLPVEPEPEAEKVDLRHQLMDERKNGEEWMLDFALQQAVTKLAPARKRKVALLVEAFETVMPIPKYETHLRHSSATFPHARPIQACS